MPDIPFNAPRKNNYVQSILFDSSLYNLRSARKVIRILGYYDYGHRYTDRYIRFRQFSPHKNKMYNTVESNEYDGVKFVIEY